MITAAHDTYASAALFLEVARIVSYLILMPGLVVRAMFLINMGNRVDAAIHITTAFLFFALTTPILARAYNDNNDPFFLIPMTIVVVILAALVMVVNVLDVQKIIRQGKRRQDADRNQTKGESNAAADDILHPKGGGAQRPQ